MDKSKPTHIHLIEHRPMPLKPLWQLYQLDGHGTIHLTLPLRGNPLLRPHPFDRDKDFKWRTRFQKEQRSITSGISAEPPMMLHIELHQPAKKLEEELSTLMQAVFNPPSRQLDKSVVYGMVLFAVIPSRRNSEWHCQLC
ncbi:hypothetical protein AVEN_210445-1 [Araneus ventricosus]|uniref:Uncharacterized protein n=1 Tax=Araneus ventricosus TaxID=182803 RepID=A0A4Y2HUQ5_ARAVE|nr:hypothetical protein AVEN_210445-1 [Araneus ventricosus]